MKTFVAVTDNRFGDQRSDNDCSHLVRRSLKRKTVIMLPDEISGNTFKNVLTGEEVTVVRRAGKRVLALADVFSCFPVAMLEGKMDFPFS